MSPPFRIIGTATYECYNGCGYMGTCPGHTIELHDMKHSDAIDVVVDGKSWQMYDRNQFKAIINAWNGNPAHTK